MELIVYRNGDSSPVRFLEDWKFSTSDEGELDILSDNGFVVATFSKFEWSYVRRVKERDEEWPEPAVEPVEEEENGDVLGLDLKFPGAPPE